MTALSLRLCTYLTSLFPNDFPILGSASFHRHNLFPLWSSRCGVPLQAQRDMGVRFWVDDWETRCKGAPESYMEQFTQKVRMGDSKRAYLMNTPYRV